MVRVPSDSNEEERFFEVAIESGAEDVTAVDNYWEVTCDPQVMSDVVTAIKNADFTVESNEIVLNLMERLDDHDDVQSVSANFSIPDEAIEQLG